MIPIRTGTLLYAPLRPLIWRGFPLVLFVLSVFPVAGQARAQEATWNWFPIRPLNFDVAVREQNFAPNDREITVQAGLTALRYGNLEVRAIYQFFSIHTDEFKTDQHAVFLNPRWNNFIDILDFPKGKPINRVIRHALFGPLEDRAVPYVGLLGGGVMPGPSNQAPGYLYGGQIGVRFPVARGLALDMGVQYSRYSVNFQGEGGESDQWIFLTGIRF
jgi:hypothetical protein